jgi:hypothetical protein
MGAEIKLQPGNGPYCFQIHCQTYDIFSPLYPNEANKLAYGQLYICDVAEAKEKERIKQRVFGRSNATLACHSSRAV